ncbi:efflux RND transporter permease subunit [Compostibacter hankyongensis]|uniref:MMPL family transporter n=1 Tax=Compostibacter hankyongensis TaxID=1007089 RepID=A0ABP8FSR5_9BACT
MTWKRLAGLLLKFRMLLLLFLLIATGIAVYFARQVSLSYDFINAIPRDNPQYRQYLAFKQQFGEDGNMLVAGVQTPVFFGERFFADYDSLVHQIRRIPGVEDVLSIPGAVNLVKDAGTQHLRAVPIFGNPASPLDSLKDTFLSLPFYRGMLYNPATHAYLMAMRINKDVMNTARRTAVIGQVQRTVDAFGNAHHVQMHLSGLPLIRTMVADKVAHELKIFLGISFLLTAFILFAFFRSAGAVIISMVVVAIGVVWSLATVVLLGYKLTILTGLIPPLIVVIGIPNCVYFLNKYHTEYARRKDKRQALVEMVRRMGIVTLFTNLVAAIGFGVFCFTSSAILKEFGVVAGLNIMFIFLISFIFLPAILSYLPVPRDRHTHYLDNRLVQGVLQALETWVFRYRPAVYGAAAAVVVIAFIGIGRLNAVGHIVDDIPHSDRIYRDLKFFEHHFHGVMPLEILVDTRRKYGITTLPTLQKLDQLTRAIAGHPELARPLSLVAGLKFARQAYYNGDSNSYAIPNQFDIAFLAPYLRMKGGEGKAAGGDFSRLTATFMDSARQVARVSVNMADIGTARLPALLDSLHRQTDRIFDTARYRVTFTGSSITYLEGSHFIISGLRDSILLAFVLILACMFYLFRSWKMLLISMIPNIIPLLVTAGVMGWADIPLKPSTVLVFSIALGIAIDVTIRFLVNFKQELPVYGYDISATVRGTIRDTGLSIIYTGLILFAGFMIFSFSGFGGTQALGLLTSLTILLAMVANLTVLPALLLWMEKSLQKKGRSGKLWPGLEGEDAGVVPGRSA